MKKITTYKKEYKEIINKIFYPESRYEKERTLRDITYEENKEDNIRNYLIKQSIESGYEKLRVMKTAISREIYAPDQFLWHEKSLFHIKIYKEDGQKKGYYKRIVKIQSMPPSKIPKKLEEILKIKGFKK